MKKTMKHILALVIILPFLFAGCQKSETTEVDKSSDTGFYKTSVYCEKTVEFPIFFYGDTGESFGSITLSNDEAKFYVTYNIDPLNDWNLYNIKLFVGPEAALPGTIVDPESGTGQFELLSPDFLVEFTGLVKSYGPLEFDLLNLDECFIVVANATLKNSAGDSKIVWGAPPTKPWSGYYLNYCLEECEPPPPLGGCETAFAYGEDFATCFLDIPTIKNNRWGWTNGPLDEGSYSWPIYAGAGQCDFTNGTLVGTLDVEFYGNAVEVVYTIDDGYALNETHLFVGDDILPKKKNKYTTAPGQFPYSGGSSFTIDVSGYDEVYIVAHSVVCDD